MTKHTKEWTFNCPHLSNIIYIYDNRGYEVCRITATTGYRNHKEGEALAQRIVSCVNACAGLTDEELIMVKEVKAMYKALNSAFAMLQSSGMERELKKYIENILDRIERGTE
jgi:hypothetical protein